jgi:hypothetical protein
MSMQVPHRRLLARPPRRNRAPMNAVPSDENSPGTLSEFTSKLWIPDFKEIRNSLFSSGGKFAEEVWILETLAVRVTTVRGFFEWLREVREEKHIDEGTEFQPVMHKLLENITGIAYRSPHFTVFDARQTLLEGILEVKYDDGTIKLKPFSGHTDVALLKGPSGRDFFHRVTTLLEFKSPWGALHHTRTQQPRDQTLVQTELFSQNLKLRGSSRTSFVAVLTDLFATSLHLKLLQPDETAKQYLFIQRELWIPVNLFCCCCLLWRYP